MTNEILYYEVISPEETVTINKNMDIIPYIDISEYIRCLLMKGILKEDIKVYRIIKEEIFI